MLNVCSSLCNMIYYVTSIFYFVYSVNPIPHRKYTISPKLIMEILHLDTIILTSISSTPPLFWPPKNPKCQITCIDLWGRGVMISYSVVSRRLSRKSIAFESNTAFCIFKYYSSNISSQEKFCSIWVLRRSLGNHFMFIEPGEELPSKQLQTCLLKLLPEAGS